MKQHLKDKEYRSFSNFMTVVNTNLQHGQLDCTTSIKARSYQNIHNLGGKEVRENKDDDFTADL